MFDPAVAGPLVAFFRTALARSAKERHDTAAEMLAAWRSVFAPVPKTIPDDADETRRRRASRPPRWPRRACPPGPCPRWSPTAWSPWATWSRSTRCG